MLTKYWLRIPINIKVTPWVTLYISEEVDWIKTVEINKEIYDFINRLRSK